MSDASLPLPEIPTPRSGDPVASLCPNCQQEFSTPICGHCGQKKIHPGDLSLKHAWHHLVHELLHVDGKIFGSVKLLIVRPGQLTLDFLEGRRARHVHPIRLFLIIGFLFFLFAQVNAPIDLRVAISPDHPLPGPIMKLLAEHGFTPQEFATQGNARMTQTFKPLYTAVILFRGLWLWLLFRKQRPYVAEHMVIVLHLASFNMLAWLPLGSIFFMGGNHASATDTALIVSFVYFLFAARRVYGGSWVMLAFKWLLAEILTVLVMMAATFVILSRLLMSGH